MNETIFIGRKITDTAKILLLQNNIRFEVRQLIDIELNDPDLRFFQNLKEKHKSWVITSSYAAQWLKINFRAIGFSYDDTVFCLSAKQAEIISDFSIRILISDEPNAVSLAEKVKQKNTGEAIIYLSGNKSLPILANEFQSPDFEFHKTEVYKNIPAYQKITNEFAAYLFFSPSGIESFLSSGNKIKKSALIFAIGETTGMSARQHFINTVLESPVQEEVGFIEFAFNQIKKLQPENLQEGN